MRRRGRRGEGTTNARPGRRAAGSPNARSPHPPDAGRTADRTVRSTLRRRPRHATGNREHRTRADRRTTGRGHGRRGAGTTNVPPARRADASPGRRRARHDVRTGLRPGHGLRGRPTHRGRPRHAGRRTTDRSRHASRTAGEHRGRHDGAHRCHPTANRRTADGRHHRRGARTRRHDAPGHRTSRHHGTTSSAGHRSSSDDRHGLRTRSIATRRRPRGSRRPDRPASARTADPGRHGPRRDGHRDRPTRTARRSSHRARHRDRHARRPEGDRARRTTSRQHRGLATTTVLHQHGPHHHDPRRHGPRAPTNRHRHDPTATLPRRSHDGRRRRHAPGRATHAPTREAAPGDLAPSPSRRCAEGRHPSSSTNGRLRCVLHSARPHPSRDHCRRCAVGRGPAPRRCRCSSCDCSPRPDQRSMLSSRTPEARPRAGPAHVSLATLLDADPRQP